MFQFKDYADLRNFCQTFVEQNMASQFALQKNLIPEILMQISSEDLKTRLLARAEYHTVQAVFWETRITDAASKGETADPHTTGDPSRATGIRLARTETVPPSSISCRSI